MHARIALRPADPLTDSEACAAVYAPYVTGSVASFEDVPPTPDEMAVRISAARLWWVAESDDGIVVGFAYVGGHRERSAYRFAGDISGYLAADARGAGLGRALYTELIDGARTLGLWTLCAAVAQPNPASDGLHAAMGFQPVGVYRRIGWKHGAWHDVR